MCSEWCRFELSKDNITCVTPRGRSVVDYIIVPHSQYEFIQDFETLLVSKYIEQCKIQTGNATIPDHSILKCKFTVSNYKDMNSQPQVKCSRKTNNKGSNSLPSRR